MKKLLLILLLFLSVNAYSQTFYTNYMSYKYLRDKDKNVWDDWTDWEPCYYRIKIDLDSNTVIIYNSINKTFYINECVETIVDDNSKTTKYKVSNDEGKLLFIRLREQEDGVKQLYIDYDNIVYVYNLVY